MDAVHYECPQCQSVFAPADEVSSGSYARCPNCGGLAVPARANSSPGMPAEGVDLDNTPPEQPLVAGGNDAATTARPLFAELLAQNSMTDPGVEASGEPPPPPVMAPAAVTLDVPLVPTTGLEGMPPSGPPTELAAPPVTDPGQGIFSSLLMSAPDLEAPPQGGAALETTLPAGAVPDAAPAGVSFGHQVTLPTGLGGQVVPDFPTLPPIEAASAGPPPLGDAAPVPVPPMLDPGMISMPFTMANTGMVMGEVSNPAAMAPPPPPAPVVGNNGTGLYLDKDTFSDAEFEALVGGSFASASAAVPGAAPTAPGGQDGWVVQAPAAPPPLKKRGGLDLPGLPGLPSAPPPVSRPPEPSANPGALVAGLAPIPTVASLGKTPSLVDGISVLKVALVLVGSLVLGSLSGVALAPPPPRPPTTGKDGALYKLSEARRLLAAGKDVEAISQLHSALMLDQALAEAQRDLGVAYGRQQKFEEAARAYEAYLSMSPRAPDAPEIEATLKKYRAGDK